MRVIISQQQQQQGNNSNKNLQNDVTTNQHKEEEAVMPDKQRYPLLTQLGLPLTKRYVSTLFCEIVLLQSDHLDVIGKLKYSTFRGTTCSLLRVPRSSSPVSFRRHANEWLKRLLKLPLLEPSSIEEEPENRDKPENRNEVNS